MYPTLRVPLVGAAAIAAAAAFAANDHASAQDSPKQSDTLPTVVVEQQKKPVVSAKTKPKKPTQTPPESAGQPASEALPTSQSQTLEAPEETIVTGVGTRGLAVPLTTTRLSGEAIQSQLPSTSDTAELFKGVAGVSIFTSGGVSGLPAINGLNDDRVKILLNGMVVTSACPNHMNPPLSYIDPSQVVVADVIAGITPVSKGGDSIAGTIIVESAAPQFASAGEGLKTSGSLSAFYRSNGDGISTAAHAAAATQNASLSYAGAWTKANDYWRGDGGPVVLSTLYEAQNHALTFAAKNGGDLLIAEAIYASIPYQGYVNQRMDMVDNEAWLFNTRYVGHFDWGLLDARAFYHSTQHRMDILEDKKPGTMPMNVDGTDAGYSLKAEIPLTTADILRIGSEFHHETLNDWWPPVAGSMMMGPDTYVNINDGRRDRLGTFVEWEHQWDRAWSTLLGFRNDIVWMDTGDVQAYSSASCLMMMGMMCMMPNPDAAAAVAFNAREHQRTDANFDMTALVRYEATDNATYEFGYGRKTRSPNLYERYAWGVGNMAADMIGWYGDANGYIGNLDLKPEIAHTASFTAGWHDRDRRVWDIRITPYYTYVEDYIDADFVANQKNMMGMPTGFVTLRFANHDAELYGVNVSGRVALWENPVAGRFTLSGVVGYVNGENLDSGDTLYHMMPLNAQLALNHRLGGWSNTVQLTLVSEKSDVNDLRHEPVTPGYALVDLRSSYQWQNVRFDFGIDNLFDKLYYPPLGGVDWADYKAGGQMGTISPVPGQGRSYTAGVTVSF